MHLIGIDKPTYPVIRNITGLTYEKYNFTYRINAFRVLNKVKYLASHKTNPLLNNLYTPIGNGEIRFYHHFNQINISSKAFITTFETILPYWSAGGLISKKTTDYSIRQILGNRCTAIIAISRRAEIIQKQFIENSYPEYRMILDKLVHIPPPQLPLVQEFPQKLHSDANNIRFTIVGSQFFTKGGYAIIQTFSELFDRGLPIHLTIISSFNDPSVPDRLKSHYYDYLNHFLSKYAQQITYYKYLANDRVLEVLSQSHVGLLPSLGESYGYSVLEHQASGCPVITTDIEALKEINNEEVGWVITLPDKWQNSNINKRNMDTVNAIIYPQLIQIVQDIIGSPDQIMVKGRGAIERIKQQHNPTKIAQRLEEIYDAALAYG